MMRQITELNGINISWEVHSQKRKTSESPLVILIAGLGQGSHHWPEPMIEGLTGAGFEIITFDNRDVGMSSKCPGDQQQIPSKLFRQIMEGKKVTPPYTLNEMADDTIALICNYLEDQPTKKVHLIGISMGGAIGQLVALKHPELIHSLTCMMSHTGDSEVGRPTPAAQAVLTSKPSSPDREGYISWRLDCARVLAGKGYPLDEAYVERKAATTWDQGYDYTGVTRQLLAIYTSGNRRDKLANLEVPTLVLHGEDDPLIAMDAGSQIASMVPKARLKLFPGWGHDLPELLVPELVDEITTFIKSYNP